MKRAVFLFLTFFCLTAAHAQNTIGISNIVNYTKQAYGGGSQNWNIAQDRNGIMYFANNSGLLVFDGTFWRTYELPNKTIVRSLAVSPDHRIYIGGQEEIGYFAPNARGELVYTSLKDLLHHPDNDFADVWNTCIYEGHVFFRSNKRIFEYDGRKMTVHGSINWGFLGKVQTELLALDYQKGLMRYDRGQWLPRVRIGQLPPEVQVSGAVPMGRDSILVTSLTHGFFLLRHDTLERFETPSLKELENKNIYSAVQLSPGRIALITNLGGVAIIDRQGNFVQQFAKQEGIQTNNVLSAFLDKDRNLWLGLDNGIDLVNYSNAIKNIFPDGDVRNSGYTSIVYRNELYLGISTGVYRLPLDGTADLSYQRGAFQFVENSRGQVWNLSVVNDHLLLAHNKGAFLIDQGKATVIDGKTGFWTFMPLYNNSPSPVMIAGTYNGINFYNYINGVFINPNPRVHAQFESARFVAINNGVIWIAHPYKGLYKVTYDGIHPPAAEPYNDRKGILSPNHNHLYKIGSKIIVTSDKGIFEYDDVQNDFRHSRYLERIFRPDSIVSYLKEDQYGNIWFCRNKKLGVVDMSQHEPKIIYIPELNDKIMAGGFENINIIDSNNVFVAAEKGFFHINYAQYKKNDYHYRLSVLLRTVRSTTEKDGLIYGGFGDLPAASPSVGYSGNSLHLEYTSSLYGQQEHMEYSYYLKGFDADWSDWSKKTEKDYTNLPPGSYTFEVKCRTNTENESPVVRYSFTILPPWYRTWWAYTIYILLFCGLIYFFYKRQQRKYKRIQAEELKEQQRRYEEGQRQLQLQHQLAMEKNEREITNLKNAKLQADIEMEKHEREIADLRNEKLQSEIGHKNSELASSAMNLIRKMEILSKIKEDMNAFRSTIETERSSKEFQKIIKVIDKELDDTQEWEQFQRHFDSVHTNYLKKLKESFPDLTSTELKLAAYLRLNLSTKEIAQLMNISVRGVETSRYRLRKKLNIGNEVSLFDFLLTIGG